MERLRNTEKCLPSRAPYKVWRNPSGPDDSPRYLGEFYPPKDQLTFTFADFEELGFPAGCYTVLVPAAVRARFVLAEWQTIYVGPRVE
jgi:hypothetical protein